MYTSAPVSTKRKTDTSSSSNTESTSATGDSVKIDSRASQLAETSLPVDDNKVNAIRAAILADKYSIDPSKIASGLISSAQQLLSGV